MTKTKEHILKLLKLLTYPLSYLLSLLFSFVLYIRNFLYDKRILKSYHFPEVLTICIGNLSFGGSGKSPLTNYLIELLKPKFKVAVLSRGYGRKTKGFRIVNIQDHYKDCGDEPLMYKIKHPDILVSVCEDRAEGIKKIIEQFPEIQVILLDDAFQHRKIRADINIILTEYSKPFFEDKVFPVGKLRDVKRSIKRADMIVVTKVPDNTDDIKVKKLMEKIKRFTNKEIFFSGIKYQNLYSLHSPVHTINIFKELSHYNCILVTGIANPLPLVTFIKEYANHFYHLKYPDHYRFSQNDIEIIKSVFKEWQKKHPPAIIITTEKDAVRLKPLIMNGLNLSIFAVPIQIDFDKISPSFNQKLIDYVTTNTGNS